MEGDASFDDLRQLLPQNMYEDILEEAIRKNIFPFNRIAGATDCPEPYSYLEGKFTEVSRKRGRKGKPRHRN